MNSIDIEEFLRNWWTRLSQNCICNRFGDVVVFIEIIDDKLFKVYTESFANSKFEDICIMIDEYKTYAEINMLIYKEIVKATIKVPTRYKLGDIIKYKKEKYSHEGIIVTYGEATITAINIKQGIRGVELRYGTWEGVVLKEGDNFELICCNENSVIHAC